MSLAGANVMDHAAERLIERHRPELSFIEAVRVLREALPTARRLRERTRRGDERWLLPELGIVAVVKRSGRDQRPACMTILPSREVEEVTDEDLDELIAAAGRSRGAGASR